ncbi:MAG: selenium metabolism-associated LysR family transcriptional regulator [Lachnospiraceae bacterium]
MNLKQLEAYVEVADSRSFSKAAKKLFLTQPTVSAHIASLEKELNVRLFVRNTKEVGLSEDGKLLYRHAKQMVEIERQIEGIFYKNTEERFKCINIAASTIPSQYILPDILARFTECYPKEQFKVSESDSAKVVEAVINHSVDIGFTGTVMEKKHCRYIPFYKDELVVIMPNNDRYRKLSERPLPEWIGKERVIMREEGSGTRKEAEKQLRSLGVSPEKLSVAATMDNQEAIKRSVISGMGISIISKLAAQEQMDSERIIGVAIPGQGDGRNLNVVYNKNYQLSCSAEKFLKIVKRMYLAG